MARLRALGYVTITQPTLSRIIREEELIRAYVAAHPEPLHHKRRPLVRLPEVEAALSQWVLQKQSRNLRLNGAILCEKARDFCRLLNVPHEDELKFSNGWLNRFKARLGLHEIIFHGEAASAPIEALADERYRLHDILPLFLPCNTFNIDETAMFWKASPNRGLATESMAGTKGDKTRLTYALCANMDGSEKLPELIIGHAKKPRCFAGTEVRASGYDYYWNKTAWMVQSIWQR